MTTEGIGAYVGGFGQASPEETMSACPLGTPAGAGPLIGWVRGPKSEIEVSFAGQDEPTHFVLTCHDNTAFDGHDSGFFSSDTLGRIWLWTEAQLVVGRVGRGVGGIVPDAAGAVALAFGLDSDNHLVFACYKGVKHPTASDSSDMANLMVRLVHVTPISVLDGPPPRPEAVEEMPNSSTSADIVDRSQTLPNWELLTLNDLAQVEVPLLAAKTRNAYQLQPHADGSAITSSAEPPERRSLLGVALSQGAAKTAVAAATVSWVVARITRACARSLRNTAELIVRPARQPDRPRSITSNRSSIRGHLRFAIAAMVLLAGGMGGWAATTELSGAVIAMGQLVVDSNVKKIQHPFGGVIAELHVRDGDRVNAGEVLVRLDGTETRANLAIVSKALDQLSALQARDQAMRDGAAEVSFPPELLDRAQDPVIAELIKGERRLFDTLISGANGRKAQLREQVAQFDEQTRGMQKQLEAKAEEIDWNAQELVGIRDLWKQKLIDFARVTTAERDAARLEGEHGALVSSIAELKGKIAETQLRILQVDEDMRTDVGKELADVRGKIAELVEKKVAAEDRLQRLEIRAPQSGIIHELEFHTVGGVIQPGATIMGVVPDGDALTAEIKIAPPEIDQLHVGQKAILRFLSFNQQTTPEVTAELTLISADVTADPKTGTSYYTARVKVVDDDTSRIAGLKLVAGMPVEVFVQTTPRTVVSYLARPIADQIERAFRER